LDEDSRGWFQTALLEVMHACQGIDVAKLDALVVQLSRARRVVTYGAGREGLMMRALCMRLSHGGLDAHAAGDMSVPRVGDGGLVIVSSGPGDLPTVLALQAVARRAGAQVALLTAASAGDSMNEADLVVRIPAQTLADHLARRGVLPMGSAFELVELLLSDLIALRVASLRGQGENEMVARHANIE
jgi:6-phospho-3-hexuloisomerase